MHISRIQVEDGFLDGLDLELCEGLNVVIGARGTGKSSIVELIRFALAIPAQDPDTQRRTTEHARAVLGDGEVTVTITRGADEYTFSRTSSEREPRTSAKLRSRPIIFSQSEIESVGLSQQGRLRLIDGFSRDRLDTSEEDVIANIRSTSAELTQCLQKLITLEGQQEALKDVEQQIATLRNESEGANMASIAAKKKATELDGLSNKLLSLNQRLAFVRRNAAIVERFNATLQSALTANMQLEDWPEKTPDPIAGLRDTFQASKKALKSTKDRLTEVTRQLQELESTDEQAARSTEQMVRTARKQLEELQKGAGAFSKQLVALQQKKLQLDQLRKEAKDLHARRSALQRRRNDLLAELENRREARSATRTTIAETLSSSVGPRVKVSIKQAANLDAYASAIAAALKGSGLRYNELAPLVAQSLSPQELVNAAEGNDTAMVARVCGVSTDRASRLLAELRRADLADIATASIDDDAEFLLLDGNDYKSLGRLSTGQRCTVILPILLEHRERLLILDQPEDHIDNAFIVDTLIGSMLRRGKKTQTIVTTHNANIPVLGEASRVILMGSDGQVGFVEVAEELDAPPIVTAIKSIMEGGDEAFKRRSAFYRRHSGQ